MIDPVALQAALTQFNNSAQSLLALLQAGAVDPPVSPPPPSPPPPVTSHQTITVPFNPDGTILDTANTTKLPPPGSLTDKNGHVFSWGTTYQDFGVWGYHILKDGKDAYKGVCRQLTLDSSGTVWALTTKSTTGGPNGAGDWYVDTGTSWVAAPQGPA